MKTRIEQIIDKFAEKGIKPSLQRIKIMDYLMENRSHPTIEMVYKQLLPEIPTLSKTTVYNTLKLLNKHHLVMTVNIDDSETRYDAHTNMHGHFKCYACQQIFDFELNESEISTSVLGNVDIHEHHIYLKGVCQSCKGKDQNHVH